jgi:hypothetical protein
VSAEQNVFDLVVGSNTAGIRKFLQELQVLPQALSRISREIGKVDPGDVRTHHLGSCFAVPGAAPSSKKLDQANDPDGAMVLEAPMIKAGKNAEDFAALASLVDANFQKVKDLFLNWMPVPNDGGAALKLASTGMNFDSVKAMKLKVE